MAQELRITPTGMLTFTSRMGRNVGQVNRWGRRGMDEYEAWPRAESRFWTMNHAFVRLIGVIAFFTLVAHGLAWATPTGMIKVCRDMSKHGQERYAVDIPQGATFVAAPSNKPGPTLGVPSYNVEVITLAAGRLAPGPGCVTMRAALTNYGQQTLPKGVALRPSGPFKPIQGVSWPPIADIVITTVTPFK